MFGIKTNIKLYMQNKKIKKRNPLSFVRLVEPTKIDNIFVGKGTYGDLKVISYSKYDGKLYIGNYCSIARNTTFLIGGEHNYNRISTYPFKKMYLNEDEATCKGNIYVEDDVWIGYGSTILSGVKIGQGAIIGAESVVTKDIPPYAIYAGGKIVKYRFKDEVIEKLLKLDYSKLDKNKITENINELYENIDKNNIDKIINTINSN